MMDSNCIKPVPIRRPGLRRIMCGLLMLLAIGCVGSAAAQTVLVVYEAGNPNQQRLLQQLFKRFAEAPHSGLDVQPLPAQAINQKVLDQSKAGLILSLGHHNAQLLLGLSTNSPVLHALIPQTRVHKLFSCLTDCQHRPGKHSQLILDQPLERQFALIRLVHPDANRIGVFKGSLDTHYLDRMQSLAREQRLELVIEDTSPRLTGSHIDQLARNVDILMATADPSHFNPSTIPEILLTTYRHHVPVLGFSRGFVRAGAIAAITSSLDQISQQIDEILLQFQATGSIPRGVIYPKYYQVNSNRNVARSLNLKFMDDAELLKRLKQHELAN